METIGALDAYQKMTTLWGGYNLKLLGIECVSDLKTRLSELGVGLKLFAAHAWAALHDDTVHYPKKILKTRIDDGYKLPRQAWIEADKILGIEPELKKDLLFADGECNTCGEYHAMPLPDGINPGTGPCGNCGGAINLTILDTPEVKKNCTTGAYVLPMDIVTKATDE
jgi:hypothetical protein